MYFLLTSLLLFGSIQKLFVFEHLSSGQKPVLVNIPIFEVQTKLLYIMRSLIILRVFSLLFLLFFSGLLFANNDSIINLIKNAHAENEKIDLYLQMSLLYKESNTDSSLFYATKALDKSILNNTPENIARSYFILGKTQMRRDSIIRARDDFYKSLFYVNKCDCKKLESEVLMFLGKSYTIQDNYFEAIDYLMQSLQIAFQTFMMTSDYCWLYLKIMTRQ